uniref:tRNA(Ile)-lysidine synthase, chloroplastic n=1 Tax=Staurastrum punctulatum TaxID=102822 RepID=TILS_STAPU|nr:hypothetical chloroplast RF62 [Staurastrum punctulatum]Q32RX0.1 RecName: Full=tRNA(Ile)-lysidine synthase, chloroplastic; AltName: Full=tRNA(Ile)-2-lysyl-cytidine synthase; AltName: Full=tRNA(Ile)-lysidine synthetase [Staurastrum punctulatum]AAX45766.1 hypothetical chloroplast RF62 [Staurastrum punctulatum]
MQNNKDNYLKFTKMDKKSIRAPYDQNDLSKKIQRIKKREDIFLLYKINNIITEHTLLQPKQRILIAVSGGQDSICLLRILFDLQRKWSWKLGIIHCDHRWNSRSKIQAEHVACLAINLQINYHEGIAIESVQKESIARLWRYNVIQSVAISNNYTAIITGHNASDRIETLLYNLMRGSGLHGLQSIKWKRNLCFSHFTRSVLSKIKFSFLVKKLKFIKTFMDHEDFQGNHFFFLKKRKQLHLIRPFLETTRTEIRNILTIWNFPSWPDVSNKELRIRRNRIRHRVIPYIRIHYNPNIDQTLVRWAEIVQSETFYLEQLTNYILFKIEIKKKISSISLKIPLEQLRKQKEPSEEKLNFYQSAIPVDLLRSLPVAIQRRVLKQYIYINTNRILGFQYIEQIRLSCLFSLQDSLRKFLHRHRCRPIYLSEHISTHSMKSSTSDTCIDWKGPKEKKKLVTPWLIFPGGIKFLIRKNYLFIFSPKNSSLTIKRPRIEQ